MARPIHVGVLIRGRKFGIGNTGPWGRLPKQPYYFRVVAANGEQIASSEQYEHKADAIAAAKLVVGEDVEIRDLSDLSA